MSTQLEEARSLVELFEALPANVQAKLIEDKVFLAQDGNGAVWAWKTHPQYRDSPDEWIVDPPAAQNLYHGVKPHFPISYDETFVDYSVEVLECENMAESTATFIQKIPAPTFLYDMFCALSAEEQELLIEKRAYITQDGDGSFYAWDEEPHFVVEDYESDKDDDEDNGYSDEWHAGKGSVFYYADDWSTTPSTLNPSYDIDVLYCGDLAVTRTVEPSDTTPSALEISEDAAPSALEVFRTTFAKLEPAIREVVEKANAYIAQDDSGKVYFYQSMPHLVSDNTWTTGKGFIVGTEPVTRASDYATCVLRVSELYTETVEPVKPMGERFRDNQKQADLLRTVYAELNENERNIVEKRQCFLAQDSSGAVFAYVGKPVFTGKEWSGSTVFFTGKSLPFGPAHSKVMIDHEGTMVMGNSSTPPSTSDIPPENDVDNW